ncbi:MAG: hypothetical protein EAX89_06425 [Candidatus Lokiarchaeota archaeon]|nr:hypothetical protein [Candidatus Lokiarchaeota archaeon]
MSRFLYFLRIIIYYGEIQKKIINDVIFMGLYMMTVWYPPDKAPEMAKLYLKQPRKLPSITKWRVFNTAGGLNGMKQYHLVYTEKGKMEEASAELIKYFTPFINIEGFRYAVEPLMGVSDSYKLLGMKWE